jgi:hypothetical protein
MEYEEAVQYDDYLEERYGYKIAETICTGCNNFTRNCECKEREGLTNNDDS